MRTGPHPDRLSPRGVSLPRPGGVWTRHARPRQGWEFADRPCSGQLGGGPAAPAAAAAAPGAIQPRCPRRRVGAPLLRAPPRLGPHRVGGWLALPAAAAAQHRGESHWVGAIASKLAIPAERCTQSGPRKARGANIEGGAAGGFRLPPLRRLRGCPSRVRSAGPGSAVGDAP